MPLGTIPEVQVANSGVRKVPKDKFCFWSVQQAGHRLVRKVHLRWGACTWLCSVGLLNGTNGVSGDVELESHNKHKELTVT